MRAFVVALIVYVIVGTSLNTQTDIGELNAGLIGGAAALVAGFVARRRPSERHADKNAPEDKAEARHRRAETRQAAKEERARVAAIRDQLGHDGASWQSAIGSQKRGDYGPAARSNMVLLELYEGYATNGAADWSMVQQTVRRLGECLQRAHLDSSRFPYDMLDDARMNGQRLASHARQAGEENLANEIEQSAASW